MGWFFGTGVDYRRVLPGFLVPRNDENRKTPPSVDRPIELEYAYPPMPPIRRIPYQFHGGIGAAIQWNKAAMGDVTIPQIRLQHPQVVYQSGMQRAIADGIAQDWRNDYGRVRIPSIRRPTNSS